MVNKIIISIYYINREHYLHPLSGLEKKYFYHKIQTNGLYISYIHIYNTQTYIIKLIIYLYIIFCSNIGALSYIYNIA